MPRTRDQLTGLEAARSFARYLRAHGVTLRWSALLLAFAGIAGGAHWVTIPAVNPDPQPMATMETIGTLLGLPIAAGIAMLLPSQCPQFEATGSTRLWPSRLALVITVAALCAGAAVIVGLLAPPTMPLVAVLRTYGLIVGVHLLGQQLFGAHGGFVASAAFVGVQSVAGLAPWAANLLFNPPLSNVAWAVAGATWAVTAATFLPTGRTGLLLRRA